MRNVDERQLATIVAALRFFNRHYDAAGHPPIAVLEAATTSDGIKPLTPEEVEALAEGLNNTTSFGTPEQVTVVAMTARNGFVELSGYVKENDAWEAVGGYADLHWDSFEELKDLPKPDDPRERADAFFGTIADGSCYDVAILELRWEPKRYEGPDKPKPKPKPKSKSKLKSKKRMGGT